MCKKIVKNTHFLLLALLISGSLNAKVSSYVGGYAQAGEWSLMPSGSPSGMSLGVGGGLGFLYELQASSAYSPTRFLFDVGVGAQGGMTSFAQRTNSIEPLKGQYDLQGEAFTYVYELKNRHDQYTNVAVQVPVLFGLQHHRFYMLAGVKANLHMMSKSHAKADLSTYGLYSDVDPFRNMPEYQFFENIKLDKPVDINVERFSLDASLEIGGRLGFVTDATGYDVPKSKMECRLAAFVDYGVMEYHKASTLPAVVTDGITYDTDPNSPNYVYQSTTMVDKLKLNDITPAVNNFMVGIKFTILFQLPEPGQCVICRDAYRSSARIFSSRKGMQYDE